MSREPNSSRDGTAPPLPRRCFHVVMAGLVPAIHDLSHGTKNVDARDKPGHDEFVATAAIITA
ncbi:hypothetical protein CWO91_36630 [Bradyrhizobium genosp. SA-3]|nr:hypothetical protein CWO91_36630 [Bradyrhizobium genosp. SA-3]